MDAAATEILIKNYAVEDFGLDTYFHSATVEGNIQLASSNGFPSFHATGEGSLHFIVSMGTPKRAIGSGTRSCVFE
jgi:hypothetical protein